MPARKPPAKKTAIPPYPGKREKGKESLVKVAAIQFEPRMGNKDHSVSEGLKLIEKAGKMGVKLMVLPELSNTGYIYNSREEAFAMSEPVPGGPTTREWIRMAKKYDATSVPASPSGRAITFTTRSRLWVPTDTS